MTENNNTRLRITTLPTLEVLTLATLEVLTLATLEVLTLATLEVLTLATLEVLTLATLEVLTLVTALPSRESQEQHERGTRGDCRQPLRFEPLKLNP